MTRDVLQIKSRIPYGEFDPQVVELCRAVNEFPGIVTTESCQGYINDHRPDEPWTVFFAPNGPVTSAAYCSIEFLVYLLNGCGIQQDGHKGFKATVCLNSADPGMNGPGATLYWFIEGTGRHPNELATAIREQRKKWFYVPRSVR